MRYGRAFVMAGTCVLLAGASGAQGALPVKLPEGFTPRPVELRLDTPKGRADDVRDDALARASVWAPPAVPPGSVDLSANPGPFPDPTICRFQPSEPSGATPKFDCVFEGGEVLKVKYGSEEVHSEAVASRLLSALGFGADRIYLVRTLRCFGCRFDPYTQADNKNLPADYGTFVDFHNVAVERRLPGKAIEGDSSVGWSWEELDKAQAEGRGSSRAERDALRLMAVLLNNWDNRKENQRLLCLPEGYPPQPGGHCGKAIAYMHDVGGTFGRVAGSWNRVRGKGKEERKLDVEAWRRVPIWKDRAACKVDIKSPRLHGATFDPSVISEPGRRLLADLLAQVRPEQMQALFDGALVEHQADAKPASADASAWAAVLQEKVRQITEGAPCPTL
ncbi:MAG TPA: hypothetical protein VFQ51_12315 [Vicinamibacteria bacterium]|nr:hypothetical protein [Vicinamibacteria bacterium]